VARDITDDIPLNIGNPASLGIWSNSQENYDVAIGGMPFFLAVSNEEPYRRETAPYRKDQFDNSSEPGEQSLTGWWIRSQQSFHGGSGIRFYDPSAGEVSAYRFKDSQGVNVFTVGEVTLLRNMSEGHITTAPISSNGRVQQHLRSIRWTQSGNTYDGCLLLDGYDINKTYPTITAVVTNKALTSNVATLTTSAAHGMAVGMTVDVTGVDATFNGSYTITAVTSTTLSYAKTAADVPSAVSTGTASSNDTHFQDYAAVGAYRVYAICDDGVFAYWIALIDDSGTDRTAMYKKLLNDDQTVSPTLMWKTSSIIVTNAAMEFTKERIVACINNIVYEMSPTAAALPTPTYTNPNVSYLYTSITASGPAIYTAGYSGMYSTIQKYTLVTSGATAGQMPSLSSAAVAAEFAPGEVVHKILYYLGYMIIGTSKGVRVALVNDQDGSITYGPLIVETTQPVYDMCVRDHYVWCTTNVNGNPGLTRIDLSNEIGTNTLRFAYANDVQVTTVTGKITTACAFLGNTNRVTFATNQGFNYQEDASTLVESGYITTGVVRYGTLEPKNFKFIRARGLYSAGSMDIQTVDANGNSYDVITYNALGSQQEAATLSPAGSQEVLGYKFILRRDTTTTSTGPTFKGYQIKALPATKRQRLIQFPVWCFDVETDRYDVKTGYEGRAWERLQTLEDIEAAGDIITYQDFTTGERVQVLIEKVDFVRKSPPSGRFDGFGGILNIIVRTVL
jgi:hypothetical protein